MTGMKAIYRLKLILAIVSILLFVPACGIVSGSSGSKITGTAAHTLIVEPDDGRTAVINAIGSAKSSIDLTIYSLSDPTVEAGLITARANGAAVSTTASVPDPPKTVAAEKK